MKEPCRLCGVSFNIGRFRTADELPESGWNIDQRRSIPDRCEAEDGCYLHNPYGPGEDLDKGLLDLTRHGDEEDFDWVEDEEEEEEDESETEEDKPSEPGEDCLSEVIDVEEELGENATRNILRNKRRYPRRKRPKAPFIPGFDRLTRLRNLTTLPRTIPLGSRLDSHLEKTRTLGLFEHVAGTSCQNQRGYNGHRVTSEELRGCNTYQYPVPIERNSQWVSEPHDRDFENRQFDEGNDIEFEYWESEQQWFLSGLADVKPTSLNTMLPVRHGADYVRRLPPELGNRVITFHPTCFDILSRVWEREYSSWDVDMTMVVQWLTIRIHMGKSYHPDVDRSCPKKYVWHHHPGLEYLAANPLFVPRLDRIFKDAIQNHPSFSTQLGAFDSPKIATEFSVSITTSQDPFVLLPPELGLQILDHLVPKDIANLRLATQAFRQLPIFFFRKLILQEMPWLWEARSHSKPPYIWAAVPFSALEEQWKSINDMEQACDMYLKIIGEEMPELVPKWEEAAENALAHVRDAQPDRAAECYAEAIKNMVVTLPIDKTNWYQVYTDIKRHWDDLKGLQNRKRIWGQMEAFIEFGMFQEFRARHFGEPLGYPESDRE